jgi:hypothetical protein
MDLDTHVGADRGFWQQPGVDPNRRWGSNVPAQRTRTMGERGLAPELGKFRGRGMAPQMSTQALTQLATPQPQPVAPRGSMARGRRTSMHGGGAMMGAPSIQSLRQMSGQGIGGY